MPIVTFFSIFPPIESKLNEVSTWPTNAICHLPNAITAQKYNTPFCWQSAKKCKLKWKFDMTHWNYVFFSVCKLQNMSYKEKRQNRLMMFCQLCSSLIIFIFNLQNWLAISHDLRASIIENFLHYSITQNQWEMNARNWRKIRKKIKSNNNRTKHFSWISDFGIR